MFLEEAASLGSLVQAGCPPRVPSDGCECATCASRETSAFCSGLSGDDLVAFHRLKRDLHYKARQTVFYEGHACLGFYLLRSGRVKLTRSSPRGQRRIVRLVGAGALLNTPAFQAGAVHATTCETLEPASICFVEREPYLALIRHHSDLALHVIELLSQELGGHLEQADAATFYTARERLAALLVDLGQRFGQPAEGAVRVGLALKREELAELAGITVAATIRLLGAFREEGLVALEGRTITLLQVDRLTRLAPR